MAELLFYKEECRSTCLLSFQLPNPLPNFYRILHGVMPLEITRNSKFVIFTSTRKNVVDARTSQIWSRVAPLNTEPWNYEISNIILSKYQI
jgi:hypothetical protein